MVANKINDFIILGPTMAPGNMVFEAVHALYFLPDNFKLILTGSKNVDRSFYNDVLSLVERDDLGHRVWFEGDSDTTQAVILPNNGMSRTRNAVTGDSAEALASAILDVARA